MNKAPNRSDEIYGDGTAVPLASLLRTLAICLLVLFPVGKAHADTPWYADYFTMVTMPHLIPESDFPILDADAFRASTLWGGWYGGWYVDWQLGSQFYKVQSGINDRHFKRHVMYYDGGEVGDFVMFLKPDGSLGPNGWTLPTWKEKEPLSPHWFGMESFFEDNPPFPFPNCQHYGLHRFTCPNGDRPASVYDVLSRRDVDGHWKFDYSCNDKITPEQAKSSGLDLLSSTQSGEKNKWNKNGWRTVRLVTQDYANPQLRDYQAWEMAKLTRELKPSGWHVDNYGDNNLYRPFQMLFGVWSEECFRHYMKEHFSSNQLRDFGINNLDTFDIREYVRSHRLAGAPNPFKAYDDPAWKNDPVFKSLLVSHVLAAIDFHSAKYDAVKAAAAETGNDVLFSGNQIPLFAGYSLLNKKIDVCHFEWQTQREYHPDRRPMGLPPQGRSAYIARLAAALGTQNYSIISLYVGHDLRGAEHENLYLPLAFDCLSNRAILDYGYAYLDMYSPGTARTAGIFNRFVKRFKPELSRRGFLADIGLVYDQWAEVAATTACNADPLDFFNEYAGWCDFLVDTHRQWNVIPSTEISIGRLKKFPLIILPSATSLPDQAFETIGRYLREGGTVLATGKSGERFGPDGQLLPRPRNPLEDLVSCDRLHRITTQPAAPYWLTKDSQSARELEDLLASALPNPRLETNASIHVGVNLSRSLPEAPPLLTLDLNNNHFVVAEDHYIPTDPATVKILVPEDFGHPEKIVIAEPEKPEQTLDSHQSHYDNPTHTLTLEIPSFEAFCFVRIFPKTNSSPGKP